MKEHDSKEFASFLIITFILLLICRILWTLMYANYNYETETDVRTMYFLIGGSIFVFVVVTCIDVNQYRQMSRDWTVKDK